MFKVNIGDSVIYKNKRYIVVNGVMSNSWRLGGLENGYEGWVKRCECKKVVNWTNFLGSFRSGYRFYMNNWYSIWKRKGVENWVKNLDIW